MSTINNLVRSFRALERGRVYTKAVPGLKFSYRLWWEYDLTPDVEIVSYEFTSGLAAILGNTNIENELIQWIIHSRNFDAFERRIVAFDERATAWGQSRGDKDLFYQQQNPLIRVYPNDETSPPLNLLGLRNRFRGWV